MPSTLTLHLQRPRQWSKRELHLQNAYLQMQSGTILSICLPTGTVQTCLRNSSSRLLWIWQIIQPPGLRQTDRKSTRLNSSHVAISYAVFCLKKKKINELETLLDYMVKIKNDN